MSSSHGFSSVCIEAGTVHPFRTPRNSSHGFSSVCTEAGTVHPSEHPGVHPMVLVVKTQSLVFCVVFYGLMLEYLSVVVR